MCLTETRKILFFISDDTPSEQGFERILSDLSVIINEGGLPLRLFGQTGNEQSNTSAMASNAQHMDWFQRQEMTEKIRSRLHIIISMSKRSIISFKNQFYNLFHYALIMNMDNWTRKVFF